jgi:hypothetical protein
MMATAYAWQAKMEDLTACVIRSGNRLEDCPIDQASP